jgi:MFS family permease
VKILARLFSNPSIPEEYRPNFRHLYLDIAWFGILSGSTINFLNVYATRIGASGFQIGLLGAMSAIVSLVFAIPAGRWLERRAVGRAVFWSSVLYRLGFLCLVPLPWLFDAQGQIWAIIVIALFMGIPLVALSVGFSALFAESVPGEWRAYVAGIRNVVLSVTFMLSSLGSGYLLNHIVSPLNYQIVFLIGFFGAAMSSFHLYFIKPIPSRIQSDLTPHQPSPPSNQRNPRPGWRSTLRIDVWKTPFRVTLLVMLAFHIAQYLALPLFPLYFVRNLHLTDENLGIGTALFYLTVLLGSTQLNRLVGRGSHKAVTGWGVVGLALYPILLAFSGGVWQYYGVSIVGGFAWSLVGGASANYILENTPENDRPAYLAWYNIILNASVLTGSLAGPALAGQIGLPLALILIGALRGLAGFAILKWG